MRPIGRRELLAGAAVGGLGLAAGAAGAGLGRRPDPTDELQSVAFAATPAPQRPMRSLLRHPGSRPFPRQPIGFDGIPQVEHIVVCMLENHTFDNMLGMLGRGNGYQLNSKGLPDYALSDGDGHLIHSFKMPTVCQSDHGPANDWNATHVAYDNGRNDGFALPTSSGPVAMGYFTHEHVPFLYGLAKVFPIFDAYHCSVMADTDPNRQFFTAGTSLGIVSDTLGFERPVNGTIFDSLSKYGITWKNYFSNLPSSATYLYQLKEKGFDEHLVNISEFFTDAKAGTLPGYSLVDPNFSKSSEENPQDVQYGDQLLAEVVDAVVHGKAWDKTLFVWTYDEGGGYFDHVPPPRAIAPDAVRPQIKVPPDQPGSFERYGMRVPAGIVSPYARRDHVSHVLSDHTSILAMIERKWNLPALTFRDANTSDLLDAVDFESRPAFAKPPRLPGITNPGPDAGCLIHGPGEIPPPWAVTPAP